MSPLKGNLAEVEDRDPEDGRGGGRLTGRFLSRLREPGTFSKWGRGGGGGHFRGLF